MKNLDYIVSYRWWFFDWKNWNNFIDNDKSIFNEKKNNVCVLFVCCNSFSLFRNCLTYLEKESNQNFDILVVDNSTNDENIKLFNNIGKENKKVSILKPIWNIWWSWWFSIWIEYIKSKKYDYLIIFEDDIVPIDRDIISNMIDNFDHKTITVNAYINEHDSFNKLRGVFHLSWYPLNLFNSLWSTNPLFFLKWDDTDLWIRIQKNVWCWNYKIKNTGKKFFHPYQKKDWWKNRVLAFSIRNFLYIFQNYCSFHWIIKTIEEQFLYIRYAFSKLFVEWNLWVLKIYLWSICDFLFWHIWYERNLKLMNKYKEVLITKPSTQTIEIKQSEITKYTCNKYYMYAKIMGHDNLFWKIQYSNKILDWLKNWIIAWWVYNPLYPVFMCFKNILFLEEYDYEKDIIKAEIYTNKNYILTLIWIVWAFILSIPVFIFVIIAVLLKILIKKIINSLIPKFMKFGAK